MKAWLGEHTGAMMGGLFGVSLVMFIGSLIAVPWIVVRLPSDYFVPGKRRAAIDRARHPVFRWLILIGKNVLGAVLLVAGFVMLILPGQGLLTILMGLMLLDFPGKWRMERYLISRPAVLNLMNWLRSRKGREPLKIKG